MKKKTARNKYMQMQKKSRHQWKKNYVQMKRKVKEQLNFTFHPYDIISVLTHLVSAVFGIGAEVKWRSVIKSFILADWINVKSPWSLTTKERKTYLDIKM